MMKHLRGLSVLCLILMAVLLGSVAQAQVIDRTLLGQSAQKLTIAIGGFAPFTMDGQDLGKLGASVLDADLKFTTIFDVMEAAILPFDPATV